MLFELLGDQMVLGDHQLFFIGIGAQLNDLHPVQQRSRHRIQSVGRGDEHHIGEVKGDLNVMVPIGTVLLSVQDFQKRRTGVTPVVGAHFIDFVQKQHRVGGSGLGHSGHDPPGHGTDIGLPMAPDVRLVMDTAQGNTNHFPVHAPGNGIRNGGFAHTGRAHQAQDLVLAFRGHFLDSHGLQNPLFHLFHAKMVFVKDFSCGSYIDPVFGFYIPGKVQHRIQIIAQDGGFRGAKGLLFELFGILHQLFLLLLRQVQGLDAGKVFIQLRILVTFAQLFPNGLDLLPQIVIPLVLVHVGPGPVVDLGFQFQDLNFLPQHGNGHFQTLIGVHLAKKCCFIINIQAGILPDGVGQEAIVIAGEHLHLDHLTGMLGDFRIGGVKGIGFTPHGLTFKRVRALPGGNRFHHAHEIGAGLLDLRDPATGQAGHKHPQIFILSLQNLLYLGNGADGIKVRKVGVVYHEVLLRNQKNGLVFLHGRLQGIDGFGPAYIKVDSLVRKNRQTPQGQNRHISGINHFAHWLSLLIWSYENERG